QPSQPVTVALSTAQLFTVAGAALDLHQIPVYLQLLCSTRKSGSIWSRVQFTPSRQNVNRWLDGQNANRWLDIQNLIAEVLKLERLSQLAGAHQLHNCLQIVALFTGYPQLFTLDRHLHLNIAILNQFNDFFRHLFIDTLLDTDMTGNKFTVTFFFFNLETADIQLQLTGFSSKNIKQLHHLLVGFSS